MRTFRQLLIGASVEDAITGMARRLGDALAKLGHSELYARHVGPGLGGVVRRHVEMSPGRPGDVLIYHAGYGDPEITRILLQRNEPIVLIYHNITPSKFVLDHDPVVAVGLEWGRRELELIRPSVRWPVADSAFNAEDLATYGYQDVHVAPVGLDPTRLHVAPPDTALGAELGNRHPNGYVLWVSQVMPHKRLELMLAAMHVLRWVQGRDLGLVIVGPNRMPTYWSAAHVYSHRLHLQRVQFMGAVSDPTLSTLFRRADLFVTTSAHEGFGLPPVEAMSFGVPVVASDAGALADTIGDAGIVLPGDAGPLLFAETAAEVLDNPRLRCELVTRGFRRVEDLRRLGDVDQFVARLHEVL